MVPVENPVEGRRSPDLHQSVRRERCVRAGVVAELPVFPGAPAQFIEIHGIFTAEFPVEFVADPLPHIVLGGDRRGRVGGIVEGDGAAALPHLVHQCDGLVGVAQFVLTLGLPEQDFGVAQQDDVLFVKPGGRAFVADGYILAPEIVKHRVRVGADVPGRGRILAVGPAEG